MTADGLNGFLEPGMLVRNPAQPDWGLGQVQSRIGDRVTVNFEHAGKVAIDGTRVALRIVTETGTDRGGQAGPRSA